MGSTSPKIQNIEWGQVKVEGADTTYKDAKIYPGGSRAWDWNETGTHHEPGIQPADVEELIENGAEEVVLSKGYWERLQVMDETRQMLENKDIEVHIAETGQAAELFNQLAEEKAVGGLFHSTC
jgi:hypothetical protein